MSLLSKIAVVAIAGLMALPLWAYEPGDVISLKHELAGIEAMLGGNMEEHGFEFILEKLAAEKVPATLIVDASVTLRRDAIVPEHVNLEFKRGNVIKLNNFRLVANGSIEAGPWQICSLENTVRKESCRLLSTAVEMCCLILQIIL